jgi:hypothetical protein
VFVLPLELHGKATYFYTAYGTTLIPTVELKIFSSMFHGFIGSWYSDAINHNVTYSDAINHKLQFLQSFSILPSFFKIFDLAASSRSPSPCVECLLRVKSFES